MTLRSYPVGNSVNSFNAIAGTPATINLTTLALGNAQNGYVASTDYQLVVGANAGNLSITLPNPNLYSLSPGDSYEVVNSATGQTLSIYPPTGGNISGAGANTAVSLTNNKVSWYMLVSFTATTSVWTAANSA